MAERLQLIRHSGTTSLAFTGRSGELTVNLTTKSIIVHDGLKRGGFETARKDLSNVSFATQSQNGSMSSTHVIQLETAVADVAQEILDRTSIVDAEIARATAAESTLQSNLDSEASTRSAADSTQGNAIAQLQSDVAALTAAVNATPSQSATLQKVYPIGALFITSSPANPSTVLGFGTWVQEKDRMIIGAGNIYGVNSIGGSANSSISVVHMPSHNHGGASHTHKVFSNESNAATSPGNEIQNHPTWAASRYGGHPSNDLYAITHATSAAPATVGQTSPSAPVLLEGGGYPFTTISPYIARYIWRRTA